MLLQRALSLAASSSGALCARCSRHRHHPSRRSFQAGRILDPNLRNQLPSPVARDEFTVLKCLAGSVTIEADAVPQYAIDDSLFLRYNQPSLALARRSGRNTARHFLQSNAAQFVDLNKERPAVPAWRPLRPVDGLENSEENLALLIGLERVDLSWRMYNKLISDGAGVSDSVKQSLLELLAYHAGQDPPLAEVSPEEIYFADKPLDAPARAKQAEAWLSPDNPARIVYRSLSEPVSLAAKAAMLKAHCRHGAYSECLDLYDKVAGGSSLDADSHVAGLLAIGAHRRSWQAALKAFRQLPGQPTAAAYRALLAALPNAKDLSESPSNERCQIVCSLLAEMRQCGVEKRYSLATGAAALRAVYAEQLKQSQLDKLQGPTEWLRNAGLPKSDRAGLLPPLLADLCANPPEPLDATEPDDLAFFPMAAYLACRVYASVALSEQLDRLLHTGAFLSMLGTFKERRIVYEYHLVNLLTSPSADLDSTLRYYSDRMKPAGVANITHLIRLMRRCVTCQAVDRLPSLMVAALAFVDESGSSLLVPGRAFFRCLEIVDQMFADKHPAVRDADFLANLRRALAGFSDALNNEFVEERRRQKRSDMANARPTIRSKMDADSAATLIRLSVQLPNEADREQAMRLAGQLAECLSDHRVTSLNYCLALLELADKMRLMPSYEQRAACVTVAELMDRAAKEFQTKRIDKSNVASLARLSKLAESANAFLATVGHKLSESQAAAHSLLARAAAEMRDHRTVGSWTSGGIPAHGDSIENDEAVWSAFQAEAEKAELLTDSNDDNNSWSNAKENPESYDDYEGGGTKRN